MNKMNNKGFLLVESLVVSTFVITVLMLLYVQFNNLMANHRRSYTYNSVENIYDLGSMADFLKNTDQDRTIKSDLGSNSYRLLYDGSSCVNLPINRTANTCNNLANAMNLKYMIYTDSDVTNIQEYAKNTADVNLRQDMRDFILKIDSTKIEGKGRLFAKFGDSVDEVSSNDRFATVAIDTNSDVNPNISKVIYDFYRYNDFNIWRYSQSSAPDKSLDISARGSFTVKNYNVGNELSELEIKTVGGWENVYIPLNTTIGTTYKIDFDYQTKSTFTPLSGYESVEVQALSLAPTNTDCRSIQTDVNARNPLNKDAMSNISSSSITFTATSEVTYLNFNFGMAADNQTINMMIGNFRIEKTFNNENTEYGAQLNPFAPDHTFNGWYTEKDGGVKIESSTVKYSKEDQVLYARMN